MSEEKRPLKSISEEESRYIWILKCVAIFFVVCAHLYPVSENSGTANTIASEILHYMGSMGVPVFYIISGYLFAGNKKDFKSFWKGKIKSLFIPWMVCYTLLYFYIVLRKGGIGILSYVQTLLGYQSTAYYLSMLVVLYLIFWISSNLWYVGGLICLSIFSIVCTGWKFGIYRLNDICGTYFLNPLNWILFFGVGLCFRRIRCSIMLNRSLFLIPLLLLSTIYLLVMNKFEEPVYYFSRYSLIAHMINIPLLFCIAAALSRLRTTLFEDMGKKSFSIYLTHQLVAGAIIAITNININPIFIVARPFITVLIVYLAMKIVERLFLKVPWIFTLLGLRRNRNERI